MVEAVLRDLKELHLRAEFVVNTDGYKVSEMESRELLIPPPFVVS